MRRRTELGITVPEDIAGDVSAKLHYVSRSIVRPELDANTKSSVTFDFAGVDESELPRIEENIRRLAREMSASHRSVPVRVLERVGEGRFSYSDDPHEALIHSGELIEFGSGRYGFGDKMTHLIHRLDSVCLQYAREFKASHRQYPTLIGADVMDRCRYLRSFPHSLCLVSHLREDLDGIEAFAREARWVEDRLALPDASLDDVKVLLSPSVCFHCYAGLAGSKLVDPLTITAIGKCFRYESGNLSGLERLWDFTMREVIFVGDSEFVISQRNGSVDAVVRLLEQLGLQFSVESASDPFFIDDFGVQSTFQKLFDLKFEIRATLPYAGTSLAVGSLNYHQDFFGRAFEVSLEDDSPVHTGCIGFGLERLALAVVAQFGPDEANWPEVLRLN